MVYVDELFQIMAGDRRTFVVGARNDHRWCHMWCVGPIEELHAMAQKIGLKRDWFQPHRTTPHYDLTPKKRELALKAGCEEFSAREWAKWNKLLS